MPSNRLIRAVARASGPRAVAEVGSTWFGPDALSPIATVVSAPRNSDP